MPNWQASIAAAVAVLDADLFVGQVWARTPQNRVLSGIACNGSAAVGDTEIEVFIDEVRVGNFFNNKLGFPNVDDLLPVENLFVPGSAQLRATVRDAATTNPVNVMVALEDV